MATGALALALGLVLLPAAPAPAADARRTLEAFVARLAALRVTDLVVEQAFTLYHPDGLHPRAQGEQHVLVKLPRRQRIEQTIDGRREVWLVIGDRVWLRRGDGPVAEVRGDPARDRTFLIVPFQRTAADLLAEWRALGVRTDVTHEAEAAGRPVVVLGARPWDRTSPAVWLDPERGVVRFVTRERVGDRTVLVDLAFTDHRPLADGVYFPWRQEAFVDGRSFLRVVVRSLAVDRPLPDRLFDPAALR